jgi:hypothetical protein
MFDGWPWLTREQFDLIGGFFLVSLFFRFRFHSLKGTRSYTRGASYYLGLLCFIAPFCTFYILLTEFVSTIEAIWLVICVWLVPWIPKSWRYLCHRIAQIPDYAYRVKEALLVAPFDIQTNDKDLVDRELARYGFSTNDLRAVHATVIQARLLRIATVMHHLGVWERQYHWFMERNSELYHSLLQSFDLLSFKIIRALKSMSRIDRAIITERGRSAQSDDWTTLETLSTSGKGEPIDRLQIAAQAAMGTVIEDLRKDIDLLLDRICLFVARGVLSNEWSFSQRRKKLESMGFKITEPPPSVVPSVLIVVVILAACSVAWFSIIGITTGGNERVAEFKILVIQTLNIVTNFSIVYYLKQRYAFANEGVFGGLPVTFILTVGFIAAIVLLPVRAIFEYYEYWDKHHGSMSEFLEIFQHSLMSSLFPWATGATTALLVQDSMWATISSQRYRQILDGSVFGIVWTAALCIIWAANRSGFPVNGMDKLPFGTALPTTFGLGFLVGYLSIWRMREASSLQRPIISRLAPALALMERR